VVDVGGLEIVCRQRPEVGFALQRNIPPGLGAKDQGAQQRMMFELIANG